MNFGERQWRQMAVGIITGGITALILCIALFKSAGASVPFPLAAACLCAGAGLGARLGVKAPADGIFARVLSGLWVADQPKRYRKRLDHVKTVRPSTVSERQKGVASAFAGGVTAIALVAILCGLAGIQLPFALWGLAGAIGAGLGLLVGGKTASNGLIAFVLGAIWIVMELLAGFAMLILEFLGMVLAGIFSGLG